MEKRPKTPRKNSRRWRTCRRTVWLLLGIFALTAGYGRWYYAKGEALRFAAKMGPGWNLGNALDCKGGETEITQINGYETRWGNPVITESLFAAVADAGFGTVRIPVTWYEHMDEEGNIEEAWLSHVQEVVDWALGAKLYVIINMHHEDWIDLTDAGVLKTQSRLCRAWEQIAGRFSRYDERLLFESMNEPRLADSELEWKGGTQEARENVNRLNAAFVQTVRNSGMQNKTRYLLLPTYADDVDAKVIEAMRLPESSHLMVTVHKYTPYSFAMEEGVAAQWSADSQEDRLGIDEMMERLHTAFIQKDIPVIIGEFGCIEKGNTEARAAWAQYYVNKAREHQMMCIWWDDGGAYGERGKYGILNRSRETWSYPEIVEKLTTYP